MKKILYVSAFPKASGRVEEVEEGEGESEVNLDIQY